MEIRLSLQRVMGKRMGGLQNGGLKRTREDEAKQDLALSQALVEAIGESD